MLEKLKDSVLRRSLVKRLEKRLDFYQARFEVLDRKFKPMLNTLMKNGFDSDPRLFHEFFFEVMPRREKLLAVIIEFSWLLELLKSGKNGEVKGLLESAYPNSSEEALEPEPTEKKRAKNLKRAKRRFDYFE